MTEPSIAGLIASGKPENLHMAIEGLIQPIIAREFHGTKDIHIALPWAQFQARIPNASWNNTILLMPQLVERRVMNPRYVFQADTWARFWRSPRPGAKPLNVLISKVYHDGDVRGAGDLPPHPDEVFGRLEAKAIIALVFNAKRIVKNDLDEDEVALAAAGLGLAYGPEPDIDQVKIPGRWTRGKSEAAKANSVVDGLERVGSFITAVSQAILTLGPMLEAMDGVVETGSIKAATEKDLGQFELRVSHYERSQTDMEQTMNIIGAAFSELAWTGPSKKKEG